MVQLRELSLSQSGKPMSVYGHKLFPDSVNQTDGVKGAHHVPIKGCEFFIPEAIDIIAAQRQKFYLRAKLTDSPSASLKFFPIGFFTPVSVRDLSSMEPFTTSSLTQPSETSQIP